jgi:hypothetical protein
MIYNPAWVGVGGVKVRRGEKKRKKRKGGEGRTENIAFRLSGEGHTETV